MLLEALFLVLGFHPIGFLGQRPTKIRSDRNSESKELNATDGLPQDHKSRKVIWVIDSFLPRIDRDSGSVRITRLMDIFVELGYQVIFTPTRQRVTTDLLGALQKPVRVLSAQSALNELEGSDVIVWLSRLPNAQVLLAQIKRRLARARIIFDTVDLHGLRIGRSGRMNREPLLAFLGDRILTLERRAASQCIATVVVSEYERELLAQQNITSTVISNIHEIVPNVIPWSSRSGQVFIANFSHTPNVSGLCWYLNEIWPNLPEIVKSQGLKIIGTPVPRFEFPDPKGQVIFLGSVPSVVNHIQAARVSIAPLLSGAGVKGKVGESFGFGVPVVLTSIAAEGMHLGAIQTRFVADNLLEFTAALTELQLDEGANNISETLGYETIRSHFSKTAASQAFSQLVKEIPRNGRPNEN